MKCLRSTVAAAVGAFAAAGLVVLTGPAAQAQEVTYMSQCKNKLAPGLEIPPSETKVDIQISPVKDTYAVGEFVTVTWQWGSYSNVPESSPLPEVPADSTKPLGQISLTGAQTGVLSVEGERKNVATPKGQPLVITDMKATFMLSAAGTLSFAPKQHSTFTQIGTFNAETECLPLTTPGVSAVITVEQGQAAERTVTVPSGEVRPGAAIPVNGAEFTPNAAPHVKLCDADGVYCPSMRLAGNTLAVDGDGNLSGNVTLSTTDVPDGTYLLAVTDGTGEGRASVTVKAYAPSGPPRATADISTGPLGTVVTVSGENWAGNRSISISGLDANGVPLLPFVNVRTNAEGVFPPVQFTVETPGTTHIRVRAGATSVLLPFTVLAGQSAQPVTATLIAGQLSMSQAGTGIDFGTATLNGEAQTLNGSLNQVTVTDARGGKLGWSLTGTMTDLAAANGTDRIPAGNVSWTPSCAATPGSLNQVANGTAGPLGSAASLLCGVTADGRTTGGKFTADAQLALTTPQFAAAGSYTGTLTLTLV